LLQFVNCRRCTAISLFAISCDAVQSAPRLIAEGFGRWGHREFAHYLSMARSEIFEVRNDCWRCKRGARCRPNSSTDLLELAERTARTIARLRSSL